MSADRIVFTEDTTVNHQKSQAPDCMRNRPELSSTPETLTQLETSIAATALINHDYTKLEFPRRVKLRVDPPLGNQHYSVHYFVPSQGSKPDDQGCYGVMKFRGSFATEDEANEHSEYLIRSVDSIHENLIGYVGREFPVCVDGWVKETKEVSIRMTMDAAAHAEIKKQRAADAEEMKQIQIRQRELVADTKKIKTVETESDLDAYIMIRVKMANIQVAQDDLVKKQREFEQLEAKTRAEILELDSKFPEYSKEFMAKYEESLATCGANVNENPLIAKMKNF